LINKRVNLENYVILMIITSERESEKRER